MNVLIYLIPIALFLGFLGMIAFLWALKSGQFEDPEGARWRILFDDDLPASKTPEDNARHDRQQDRSNL